MIIACFYIPTSKWYIDLWSKTKLAMALDEKRDKTSKITFQISCTELKIYNAEHQYFVERGNNIDENIHGRTLY